MQVVSDDMPFLSLHHYTNLQLQCVLVVFLLFPVPTNCSQGQIRLRGGSNQREGRVEICISRVWGTICDTQWDYREAQVACRQLGYTALGECHLVACLNNKLTLVINNCLLSIY